MQYIYGYEELNTAPDNPTSARVAPRRILSGPTMQTGKSSTIGAVLYGDVDDGPWYFKLIQDRSDISAIRNTLLFGEALSARAA